MITKLPAKFFKLSLLAEIPRREYVDAPDCKDPLNEQDRLSFFKLLRSKTTKKSPISPLFKQSLKFNVALWGRINRPSDNLISFLLHYKDASGSFVVVAEEAKATENLMLTNTVELQTQGEIEFIRACYAGLSEGQSLHVDELFIQRIREPEMSRKAEAG